MSDTNMFINEVYNKLYKYIKFVNFSKSRENKSK